MTDPSPLPRCYRHPDRETLIGCQRCGRPICPQCMTDAAVGVHCPDCVADGRRSTRAGLGPYGGARSANPALTSLIIIGLCVAVWLAVGLGQDGTLFDLLALTPLGRCSPAANPDTYYPGVTAAACLAGAEATLWVPGVASGALWQLLTSAFTHSAPMHIASNAITLWFIGPALERVLGRARFLAVYLLSALAGSAAVIWLSDPASSTLGASGAIFGVLGALLVIAHRVRGDVRFIMTWLGINLAVTVLGAGFISWQGHLGGLAGGLLAAAIVVWAPREHRVAWQAAGLAGLAVLMLAIVAIRVAGLA